MVIVLLAALAALALGAAYRAGLYAGRQLAWQYYRRGYKAGVAFHREMTRQGRQQ